MRKKLILIYEKLYKAFGPRNWWPGDSPFEVMIGAILTQNTAWGNVEKAIKNLKNERVLSPIKLRDIKFGRLKSLIKPAGFYNVKAKRLKHFLNYFSGLYQNNIPNLKRNLTREGQTLIEVGRRGISWISAHVERLSLRQAERLIAVSETSISRSAWRRLRRST